MTKVEGNYATINAKEFIWYAMYLNNGECKNQSRRDVTVRIAVILPHICCLLNTEEGKNNAIYALESN